MVIIYFDSVLFQGAEIKEIKVIDINCSTSCASYLSSAVERGSAADNVDRLIAKIRALLSDSKTKHIKELRVETVGNVKKLENHLEIIQLVTPKLIKKLRKLLYIFEYYNDECLRLHHNAQHHVHRAYITFENEYSYVSALHQIPNIGFLTRLTQGRDYNLEGRTLFITVRYTFYLYCFLEFHL